MQLRDVDAVVVLLRPEDRLVQHLREQDLVGEGGDVDAAQLLRQADLSAERVEGCGCERRAGYEFHNLTGGVGSGHEVCVQP